jgi:predicted RNA methylase
MGNSILSPEVVGVLTRARANGNVIVLPEGQLDRKLYEAVNKALANAGGKWKRGTGHVFPGDAAPKLAAMLGSGVSVDEKKRDQSFFTSPELAQVVADIADVRGCDVLEPEAGNGSLVTACLFAGAARVYAVERNPEYAARIPQNAKTIIRVADFLGLERGEIHGGQLFFRIVMNPPFTKNQDIKHVNHAIKWLAPGGILVAIMLDNQTRKGFQELVDEHDPQITPIERGAFKESGTNVPTVIVKIEYV